MELNGADQAHVQPAGHAGVMLMAAPGRQPTWRKDPSGGIAAQPACTDVSGTTELHTALGPANSATITCSKAWRAFEPGCL